MSRTPVLVRDALPDDASALSELWPAPATRSGEAAVPDARHEAAASIARIAADPGQRLLVAEVGTELAGACHLVRGGLSPVHPDDAVYVLHLQVREGQRRHGAGRALMEAAVSWAEEKGTGFVVAAASVGSRDANRFMARLGLGQVAVLRAASVASLRAKLPPEPPPGARVSSRHHRNVGQVLARRRSMRRASEDQSGGGAV